jgi:hypothetical protein
LAFSVHHARLGGALLLGSLVVLSTRAWAQPDPADATIPPPPPIDADAGDGGAEVDPDAGSPMPIDIPEEVVPVGPPQAPPPHPARPVRKAPEKADYTTRRFEPAAFPLIGGDSDIGVEFGAVGTLSYFADGVKPYRWNMDLLGSLSVKEGPSGAEVAQQSYLWQIDVPGLRNDRVRVNPEVSFNRTINEGYFGLGNASSGVAPAASSLNPGRHYEFDEVVVQARSSAKVRIKGPVAAYFAAQYLYVAPSIYAGSVLAADSLVRTPTGAPLVYGTTALSLPSFAMGSVYDSRDDEIFPRRGMLHEVGVRVEDGVPTSAGVRYIEAGAILRGYVPVGPAVLAGRFVANFQFGNVPFYDLFQAGPFDQKEMPGGSAGVRGVPVGRYSGPIKMVANVELRGMLLNFSLLRQKFKLGGDVFFDTGRIWSDTTFHSPIDGTGVGLKYGVGAGVYVLWGQAALIRLEAAYSPDAVSENPQLPIGIYVEDGVMF